MGARGRDEGLRWEGDEGDALVHRAGLAWGGGAGWTGEWVRPPCWPSRKSESPSTLKWAQSSGPPIENWLMLGLGVAWIREKLC